MLCASSLRCPNVASPLMDLGIAGKSAIVCASSQGLGLACAEALIAEGVAVVINGRDEAKLATTADALRAASPNATGHLRGRRHHHRRWTSGVAGVRARHPTSW